MFAVILWGPCLSEKSHQVMRKAREFAENGTDVPACDAILETATVQKILGLQHFCVLRDCVCDVHSCMVLGTLTY